MFNSFGYLDMCEDFHNDGLFICKVVEFVNQYRLSFSRLKGINTKMILLKKQYHISKYSKYLQTLRGYPIINKDNIGNELQASKVHF